VQVFDVNYSVVATLVTIPTERSARTGDTLLVLANGEGHEPDAVLQWFYSGRMTGHQFVYASRERRILAEQPTLTIAAERSGKGNKAAKSG
jgi:hypothetical protein